MNVSSSTPALVAALAVLGFTCVAIAQSGGDYAIKTSTIDGGGGQVTGGGYVATGTIGQHDTAALGGGGYSLLGGFWPMMSAGPGAAAPLAPCPNDFELASNGAGGERLSRFGCVSAPEPPAAAGGGGSAIRVVFRTLYNTSTGDPDGASVCVPRSLLTTPQPSLSQFKGQTRWLGAPVEIVDETTPPSLNYIGAPLVCTASEASVRDWSPAGLAAEFGDDADSSRIYFYDFGLVPCSVYEVAQCSDPLNEGSCSEPVLILTSRMADAWPPFDVAGQPSFSDVNAEVNKFKSTPFAPGDPPQGGPPEWHSLLKGNVVADYNVSVVNKKVSFLDIGVAVDGVRGIPYKEQGPCDAGTGLDNCGNACTTP